MGRRNLPCSTVNAQTENWMGARRANSNRASKSVTESLPPDSATATRSPSRIILKRAIASPTFRNKVFSSSIFFVGRVLVGCGIALLAQFQIDVGQIHATHLGIVG